MRTATMVVARSLSVLGHPLVVVPAVVAVLVFHEHASSSAGIVSVVCIVALAVLAFSLWQVHRGR
jgi:hypothetical protein